MDLGLGGYVLQWGLLILGLGVLGSTRLVPRLLAARTEDDEDQELQSEEDNGYTKDYAPGSDVLLQSRREIYKERSSANLRIILNLRFPWSRIPRRGAQ